MDQPLELSPSIRPRLINDYFSPKKEVEFTRPIQAKSVYSDSRTGEILRLLIAASNLPDGWDSYRAPKPNGIAVQNALLFLSYTVESGILRQRIGASADGGIMVECKLMDSVHLLDFYNTGEIVHLHKTPHERMAVEIKNSDLRTLAEKIGRRS